MPRRQDLAAKQVQQQVGDTGTAAFLEREVCKRSESLDGQVVGASPEAKVSLDRPRRLAGRQFHGRCDPTRTADRSLPEPMTAAPHPSEPPFPSRREAGRILALRLLHHADCRDVTVLALPRGGVPVAYEVAMALHAPLDVFLVRKLGVPGYEELAMGAIASGGIRLLNDQILATLDDPEGAVALAMAVESAELYRREARYRGGRPAHELRGRTVILVDDGLATGAAILAAVQALRQRGVASCTVAAPVAVEETYETIRGSADEFVCLTAPGTFPGAGALYRDCPPPSDDEVVALLEQAARLMG